VNFLNCYDLDSVSNELSGLYVKNAEYLIPVRQLILNRDKQEGMILYIPSC
ncbi:uncharacterized protein METZ01_LOCUS379817, partial [marine metagenome]